MSKFSEKLTAFCERHPTLYKCVLAGENVGKKLFFKCQDCGQCVLSYNAFTCCMRCPKELRNGPCGGTRPDGHCEVYPERHCIWWLINKRAKWMKRYSKMKKFHKPYDYRQHHTSAWLNMFAGRILPLNMSAKYDEAKEAKLEEAVEKKRAETKPPLKV